MTETCITLRNRAGRTLMQPVRAGAPVRWSVYGTPITFPTWEAAELCRAMLDHRAEIVNSVIVGVSNAGIEYAP